MDNTAEGDEPQGLRVRRRRAVDPGYVHIQRAILENDHKRLAKLLGQRVKLKLTAEDVAVALMEAISQGKAECIQPLLAARADPNCVDEEGKTPMIVCMESKAGGNPSILRELLKAGSSPNKATFNTQQTALHVASKKGYQVAVKVLLSSGARVDKSDYHGYTSLMYAAREGHYTAVKMLLEHEANPDCVNKLGETPLLLAAKGGHIDCAEELLEHGADPDHRDGKGQTALMLALRNSQMDMVELIMSYNCDINVQSGDTGKTILHWAVQNGDLKLVQSLLRLGAVPNIRDRDWETPFITALLHKRLDVLHTLIKYKCDIKVTDKNFKTGLHLAAREGLTELIPLFLKAGLDCDLKTASGQTPLMLAAAGGHVEIVSLLLSHGANTDAMDRHRATALVYAIMSKAEDTKVTSIVKLLIRSGCHLDEGTNLIKFLKDNKLDPGKRGVNLEHRPYAPVEMCFLRGRPVIFLMLLKSGCSVKEFSCETLKHGQDWLSPQRTEFRTVLYLLKHVKTEKKHFPTLKQLCRNPAVRLMKDPYFKPHISAVKPSAEIVNYLRFSELDDLEKNFSKMIATTRDSDKSGVDNGPTRASEGFSRLSSLRSTYTLGSNSANRRRVTTTDSTANRMTSESSEDDEVFRTGPGIPKLTPRKPGNSRNSSTSEVNGRLGSNSSSENNNNPVGMESWVKNQIKHTCKQDNPIAFGRSPIPGRKFAGTPGKKPQRKPVVLKSPKTPTSIENMLFASPPVSEEPNYFKFGGNRDSVVSNDTGFHSQDTARCDSPTEMDLSDMKAALMWKSFTTPFDSWDSESIDSASVPSISGSQDSRDTDLSDLSRGSGSNAINVYNDRITTYRARTSAPNSPSPQPLPNGTPTATRKSKIPVFRRPTPKAKPTGSAMNSSHFVEVDDDRPGRFVRSKSCRK